MSERRYQMIRLRAGDYLLPSNDLETMFRIASYQEHGDAEWRDEQGRWHKIVGTYWSVYAMRMAKLKALTENPVTDDEDVLDWNEWEHRSDGFGSRRAAIEDALSGA